MKKIKQTIQLLFNFSKPLPLSPQEFLILSNQTVPLNIRYNRRSGRYLLKVKRDASVHLTIPAFGSKKYGLEFARLQKKWIEKRLQKISSHPPIKWQIGSKILLRGEETLIKEIIPSYSPRFSIQTTVENHLWNLAQKELPMRTQELASQHQFSFKKVTVRNQNSRWGSCSQKAAISLNWRLIQAPLEVRDYIILHELAHLKHMNHSKKFWQLVQSLCPYYKTCEKWLKSHDYLLLQTS